jgi:hypothetical protein
MSVPQTAEATASTRIEPSRKSGSGISSYRTVPGFLGSTVIAFIGYPFRAFEADLKGKLLQPFLQLSAGLLGILFCLFGPQCLL